VREEILKAEAAYLEGRADEAMGMLALVLKDEPDNPRALSGMGVMLHGAGRFKEARAAFERALRVDPKNNEARRNLCLTLLQLGDNETLKARLGELLAGNQNDFRLWHLLARAEAALGDHKAALASAERSLLLEPDQPEVRAFMEGLSEKAAGVAKAAPAAAGTHAKARLLIITSPGREWTTDPLAPTLSGRFRLERFLGAKPPDPRGAFEGSGLIWLDGLSPAACVLLADRNSLRGKTVLLRLYREDILGPIIQAVSYLQVGNLAFESFHQRDAFLARGLPLMAGARLHVLRRPVDTQAYPYKAREGTRKLCAPFSNEAAEGDLVLAMEAFKKVLGVDPGATLRVRLSAKKPSHEMQLRHFAAINSLPAESLAFSPAGEDLGSLLRKSDCFLATESQPGQPGILEALSLGLRPLIRFCLGQNEYAPESVLWRSLDDVPGLYKEPPDPEGISNTIATNNDPRKIANWFADALLGGTVGG
jgi:tetratricopeptide (TPR) repeat protein